MCSKRPGAVRSDSAGVGFDSNLNGWAQYDLLEGLMQNPKTALRLKNIALC
jgi:hypothetical protein